MGIMNLMRQAKDNARLQIRRKVNQVKLEKQESTQLKQEFKVQEKTSYRKEALKQARRRGRKKAKKKFTNPNTKATVFLSRVEQSQNQSNKSYFSSDDKKEDNVWSKKGRNVFQ